MKRIFLLTLLFINLLHTFGQDTVYIDDKYKIVKTFDLCTSYNVTVKQQGNPYSIVIQHFTRSGQLRRTASFDVVFKKDADSLLIKAYEEGSIRFSNPMIQHSTDRVMHGVCKDWSASGQLMSDIDFKDGLKDGKCLTFWDNQKPKRIEKFEKGKSVEGKCFDREGNEISFFPYLTTAEFPGGEKAMNEFIASRLRYPIIMAENNIMGTEIVRFSVNKDGDVENISSVRSIAKEAEQEVFRIIRQFPKFKPMMVDGEPHTSYYTLPVRFILDKGSSVIKF